MENFSNKILLKPEVLGYIFMKHNYKLAGHVYFTKKQVDFFAQNFCKFIISKGYQPVDEKNRPLVPKEKSVDEIVQTITKAFAYPLDEYRFHDYFYFKEEDLKAMRAEFNNRSAELQSCILMFEESFTRAEWTNQECFDAFESLYNSNLDEFLETNKLKPKEKETKIYTA